MYRPGIVHKSHVENLLTPAIVETGKSRGGKWFAISIPLWELANIFDRHSDINKLQ